MTAEHVRQAPNMRDVARVAGVSHQTVSRVLNGFEGVRPATRERVEAAIRELGYRPNHAARALVTRRSRSIGIVSPAISHYGPTSGLHAIERATREAGYRPLITVSASDRARVRESLEFLREQSVEALVLIAPFASVFDVMSELDFAIPSVTLSSGTEAGASAVSVDQFAGGRLAAEHLLALGHTRIVHVAGPQDWSDARARRDGFVQALRDAHRAPPHVLEGDWTAESGHRLAAHVGAETTAVFCANDQMAIGLVHGLVAAGRRVPEDVSVVGFDDIPESAHVLPPLTTVHQDFEELGERAIARLLAELAGTEPPREPRLEPRFVERASTAPPSSAARSRRPLPRDGRVR